MTKRTVPVKKPNMTRREVAELYAFEQGKVAYASTPGTKEQKKVAFQSRYNDAFFEKYTPK